MTQSTIRDLANVNKSKLKGLLTTAEQEFIDHTRLGEPYDCRPKSPDRDRTVISASWSPTTEIRGEVVGVLARQVRDDWPVHPTGIRLIGVCITSQLSLIGAEISVPLVFEHCLFKSAPTLQLSTLPQLTFSGSHTPGLRAGGIHVRGSIVLRSGFRSRGEVELQGSRVGGNIECDGSFFGNPRGRALTCDSVDVGGSIFLRKGFTAVGEVWLKNARIGGVLDCSEGRFAYRGGTALRLDRATVGSSFVLRDTTFSRESRLSLVATTVEGSLDDDRESWPEEARADIREFRYRALVAPASGNTDHVEADDDAPTDDPQWRIGWVRRYVGRPAVLRIWFRKRRGTFRQTVPYHSQPYTQLVEVYRNRGNLVAARKVAVAREWSRSEAIPWWGKPWRFLQYLIAGYGYRAHRSVYWLIGLIVLGGLLWFPSNDMTQVSRSAPDYHSFAYATDLAIPVLDLQQADSWQPASDRQVWLWVTVGVGWFLSGAFVAAVAGLFRPDE